MTAPWYPVAAPPPLPPYPHPEPQPYHRMLRTWTYRPWRVVVGLAATILAAVLGGPLALVVVGLGLEATGTGSFAALLDGVIELDVTPSVLLTVNLSLALLIPITWLAVRLLHNLRPRWLGSVRPGLRWRLLWPLAGWALLATAGAFLLYALVLPPDTLGGDTAAEGRGATAATTVAFLIVIALTTPLQSAGEEYLFRGYLLQGFGALVRSPWFTLLLTSGLFALAHGSQNLPLFLDRFLFGLTAGVLVLYSGGLEAGIALHVVNNVVALGVAAATGSLSTTLATADASWGVLAVDSLQLLGYAGLVVWWCRRHPVARRTGSAAASAAA
ncbi:MAG: CPBP family intramembrane metalloprotease [Actinomycetota bacterium]|nr:CPBP family intramembrane metalloprotease [Actinomycetota bacterium]